MDQSFNLFVLLNNLYFDVVPLRNMYIEWCTCSEKLVNEPLDHSLRQLLIREGQDGPLKKNMDYRQLRFNGLLTSECYG